MKTKRRLLVIVVLVTMMLIMSAGATFPRSPYALAETTAMEQSSSEVAMYEVNAEARSETYVFMNSNLDLFITEYNKTVSGTERMNASSIEYYSDIYLVDSDEPGVYFDLNGNNGYLIMSYDKQIQAMRSIGDYPVLKSLDNLYYSRVDEFMYMDSNGVYQRCFQQTSDQNITDAAYKKVQNRSLVYAKNSTSNSGIGEISDIQAYVAQNYPQIEYVSHNTLLGNSFDCSWQIETSYYVKAGCDEYGTELSNFGVLSEGNCSLNAMYALLRNWSAQAKIPNFQYGNTADLRYSIVNDSLYPIYGSYLIEPDDMSDPSSPGYTSGYYYWRRNEDQYLRIMPILYSKIRSYAITNHGYTPESGYNANYVPATLEYVMNEYYDINIDIVQADTFATIINEINSGESVHLSLFNSSTYGNHAVVITGYYKYSRYITLGNTRIPIMDYYFFQIADGWNENNCVYFDANYSNANLVACILND